MLAFILAFARGLPEHLAHQRQHRYRPVRVPKIHLAEARVLPLADFVVMTVPQTPETEGLMYRARLARMKPTAVIINVGRGPTLPLQDLVATLKAGEVAGAGLDVFDQEPLPADCELWDMPNVLITLHVAIEGPYLNERR